MLRGEKMKKLVYCSIAVIACVLYTTKPPVYADSRKGEPAPDFSAEHWENSADITLRDLAGKNVVLWFWAPWSSSCKRAAPLINGLYSRYKSKNVAFVGLTKEKDLELVSSFIKTHRITFPIGAKSNANKAYKTDAVPWIVVISSGGLIAWEGNPQNREFDKTLKRLLGSDGTAKRPNRHQPVKRDSSKKAVQFLRDAQSKINSIISDSQGSSSFFSTLRSHISAHPSREVEKLALNILADIIMQSKTVGMKKEAVSVLTMFHNSQRAINVIARVLLYWGRQDLSAMDMKPYREFLRTVVDAVPECGRYDPNAAVVLQNFILDAQFRIDMNTRSHAFKALKKIRTATTIELLIRMYPRTTAYQWDRLRPDMFDALYHLTGLTPDDPNSPVRDHQRYGDWTRWWKKNKHNYVKKFREEQKRALGNK